MRLTSPASTSRTAAAARVSRGPARLAVAVVLSATIGLGLASVPSAASDGAPEAGGYPAEVADGWRAGPVHVDDTQSGIVPADEAERLAARVTGHSPAIYVAVVPAAALSAMPGDSNDARGMAFLDAVADAGGLDGAYLVVFGGAAVYGATYGVDAPLVTALETALGRHTRSQQVAIIDDTLTQLGLPGAPEESGGSGWVLPVVVVVLVAVLAAGGLLWWRRRTAAARGTAGPATYRPSFDVLDDEADSLAERQQLAREDVTRFGEELAAADPSLDDPAVAADVQAAMDAYAEVGPAVDGAPDDHVLRAVRSTVEYGRWRLACAQARLAGQPLPARRADCFFDQRHGVSVTDWMYTPPGGRAREIPVCAACRDRLAGAAR